LLSGASHVALQTPFEQTRPAPHAWLQLPQCAGSLEVSIHRSLQTTNGAVHESKHLPATQLALPAPSEQWLPHAPQLSASVSSATHTLPQAVYPSAVQAKLHFPATHTPAP
jgi:hypothetical protein